jgi:hypothetical protein
MLSLLLINFTIDGIIAMVLFPNGLLVRQTVVDCHCLTYIDMLVHFMTGISFDQLDLFKRKRYVTKFFNIFYVCIEFVL